MRGLFSPIRAALYACLTLLLLMMSHPAFASLGKVYVAQNAAGADTGADCANAHGAVAFFNSAANWGSGSSQIGPGTTVHLCGTIDSRSNGATLLTFYGDGAASNPVILLFETGAIVQAAYCANSGCINLNGHSHIVVDGGSACGKQGSSTGPDTPCNGTIRNTAVGSTGSTCIDGPCTPLSSTTGSSAIGSNGGTPTDVTIRYLNIKVYVRSTSDYSNSGNNTSGIALYGGTMANHFEVHHNIFNGMGKGFLASLGSTSGVFSGYHVYNNSFTSQCWAMGVGLASASANVTDLAFHHNEVQNWDAWAIANDTANAHGQGTNVCHTNGTMWFNYGTPSGGFGYIGDSSSGMWDNYLHGTLTGNYSGSSPSGYLSCQDNCINIVMFNNLVIDTTTGANGGGIAYFNGPGGGGQQVYNNTFVRPSGSFTVWTGSTAPGRLKNNILKCTGNSCAAIEIRPNTPDVVQSDLNDGFQVGSASWTIYNSAGSASFLSLASWQSRGTNHDNTSVTTDPKFDTNYKLQSGSPAIGLGVNLSSLGFPPLDSDAAGVLRPSSGTWDAGIYEFASGSTVQAPTGLTALVQ
jgi:hypothetical protein